MKLFLLKAKKPLLLIMSGMLTSLPLIITELGFFQWISIIPAAYLLIKSSGEEKANPLKLYEMGVLYFGAYYALSFHWFFYMYPLDFAGLNNLESIGVVLIACFGIGLLQAMQSALAFLLYGIITRSKAICDKPLLHPIVAAALFVVFEWWQTIGWWGVPWARMPLGQVNATLILRSSAVFGSYFVTFTIVAVNFFLALAISKKNLKKMCTIALLTAFCLNLTLGVIVTLSYRDDGKKVTAAAAQGNIPSNEKWEGGAISKTMGIYEELTVKAAMDGADIIVWPETVIPCVLFERKDITDYLSNLARENDITIITSAFTRGESDGEKYNSIIEVKPDGSFGEVIYSKQRLVPFGEFVPMRELVAFIFPPLVNIGMLSSDLTPGDQSTVIESESGVLGFCLCFDSIYESLTLESVLNGAELIMISTNDSWFSDSAALNMHNGQAKLRAIENGRYVVRSANTGISSIIDPMGNTLEELGALERGYIVSDVRLNQHRTVYNCIGNLFVYICMSFITFGALLCTAEEVRKIIKKN